MELTDHHLLVGKGAQDFARNMGFKIEDDLNTIGRARRGSSGSGAPTRRTTRPVKREAFHHRVLLDMIAEGLIDEHHAYGTINCDGVNAKGEICGVTTTSGLAWKIPGRVGDSPILGAGCTWTTMSVRRARPAEAKPTSTT